jgi:hypothetical protein
MKRFWTFVCNHMSEIGERGNKMAEFHHINLEAGLTERSLISFAHTNATELLRTSQLSLQYFAARLETEVTRWMKQLHGADPVKS